MAFKAAPTTATVYPTDAVAQVTALRPTPNPDYFEDDARRLRDSPADNPIMQTQVPFPDAYLRSKLISGTSSRPLAFIEMITVRTRTWKQHPWRWWLHPKSNSPLQWRHPKSITKCLKVRDFGPEGADIKKTNIQNPRALRVHPTVPIEASTAQKQSSLFEQNNAETQEKRNPQFLNLKYKKRRRSEKSKSKQK